MFRTRFAGWFRSCPIVWAVCLVAQAPVSPALRAEPPKDSLTAEQRQQLAKANRLEGEVLALYRKGRFREAVDRARQVVEIRKQALGEKHPDYATSLNNLAQLYSVMDDPPRAEPLLRQALAISRDNLELASAVQSQRQQLTML
jgi:tetratricopeptide (TPR) repeat protein